MAPTNPADLVDKATSEYLIQMDWTTCLQICDSLNSHPTNARPVVRAILRRFKEKSRVVMLALELSESLVQNCICTHEAFGESTFQTELAKLIMNKKTKDNVKEKALELVETWGLAFQYRHDIPGFYDSYSFLRRSGHRFPPKRPDAPVLNFNRDRGAPTPVRAQGSHPSAAPVPSTHQSHQSHQPQQQHSQPSMTAVRQDIASIRGSVSIFQEMVSFLNVEEEAPSQNSLLQELRTLLKENQTKITDLITNGTASENELESLLLLNDELVKALGDYDNACLRRKQFEDNGFKPLPLPEKKAVPSSNGNGLNDIDFSSPTVVYGQQPVMYNPQQQQQQQYPPQYQQQQQPQMQYQQQPQQQQQPVLLNKPPPPQTYNPFLSPLVGQQSQPQPQQQLHQQQQPQQPQQQQQQSNNAFDEFDLFIANRSQQQPQQQAQPQPQTQSQQLQLMPAPTFQPSTASNPFVHQQQQQQQSQQQNSPFIPPPATSKSTPLQPQTAVANKPAAAPMPPPFNNPFSSPYFNNPVTQPIQPINNVNVNSNPFGGQPFQPQMQPINNFQQQQGYPTTVNNMGMHVQQPQQQYGGVQFPALHQQQQQPMQFQNNPFGGGPSGPMMSKPMSMPGNNININNNGNNNMMSKNNPNQASLI
ncbi:hypothetical protein SAMD00019534_061560, partial [Acytostelium subglobosum LB1]|uniref:hypothetical protein n=1 Tax=Acytostelium subglobosum LB1 TaxID=1410327 RepID=UPI000644D69B